MAAESESAAGLLPEGERAARAPSDDAFTQAHRLAGQLNEFHQVVSGSRRALGVDRSVLSKSRDAYESLRGALRSAIAARYFMKKARARVAAAEYAAHEAEAAYRLAEQDALALAESVTRFVEADGDASPEHKAALRDALALESW